MNNLKTIGELMAQKYPDTVYIVDRLIPAESITILSGQSRSYKTYALLDIAIAVASQKLLFGHFGTTQASVLIINEEDGEKLLQQRFRQLGVARDDELPIYISALNDFKLEDDQINQTLRLCSEKGINLVIIDSLIRVHSADENSARDMSKVFAQLRKFTKAGVAVLVTQHHRKANAHSTGGASEMRGSSDILAAVDSHIGVRRAPNDKMLLTFTQEKQRFDIELEPFQVRAEMSDGSFRFEYFGGFEKQQDKTKILLDSVIELLKVHGQLMQADLLKYLLAQGVATNEHELRNALRFWISKGELPRPNRGKGKSKLYWIDVEGHESE